MWCTLRMDQQHGPCFKSDNFRRFCDQLDIGHVTSSPYHHQSNGCAERAIAIVEQILKKSTNGTDITKALTTYLDTPVSDTLPSPAELFYSRGINARLSMAMTPTPLTDQQKSQHSEKRSAHLKPMKQENYICWINPSGSLMMILTNGNLGILSQKIPRQIHIGSSITRPTEWSDKISVTSSHVMLPLHSSDPGADPYKVSSKLVKREFNTACSANTFRETSGRHSMYCRKNTTCRWQWERDTKESQRGNGWRQTSSFNTTTDKNTFWTCDEAT